MSVTEDNIKSTISMSLIPAVPKIQYFKITFLTQKQSRLRFHKQNFQRLIFRAVIPISKQHFYLTNYNKYPHLM